MQLALIVETKVDEESGEETLVFPYSHYFEPTTSTLCVAKSTPVDWWEQRRNWSELYIGNCGDCGLMWPVFVERPGHVRQLDDWECPKCESNAVIVTRESADALFSSL